MIFCNNKSVIDIAKNLVYHSRIHQISIKHHFIRDTIENDEVEKKFCKSGKQVADTFTKALPKNKFNYFIQKLGVEEAANKGEYVRIMYIYLEECEAIQLFD